VTNSHQVFVVADADTKVRYTGAYHKKIMKMGWREEEGEEATDDEIRKGKKFVDFFFFFFNVQVCTRFRLLPHHFRFLSATIDC